MNKAKYETMETKAEVCLAIVDQGLTAAPAGPTATAAAPTITDTVALLNAGKQSLNGEETPLPSGEKTEAEIQMEAGNRLAELYNKGGR